MDDQPNKPPKSSSYSTGLGSSLTTTAFLGYYFLGAGALAAGADPEDDPNFADPALIN